MNWVTVTINGQDVNIAFDANSIHIYNAFPIKDDLKMRGYRWNPSDKSWYIKPGSVDDEMDLLKNNLQDTVPVLPVKAAEGAELAKFPESFSVAELRNRIDRLIREGIRGNVWVRGVVASDVKHYKWFSYLDLKDEDESRDIFFRVEVKKKHLEEIERKLKDSGAADSLERDLPVFCNVEVYLPLRNVVDIRLSVLDILPEYTQARIRNQRDITLDRLKEEGILDNQKQLIAPMLISRIGLITSEQGTSIRDIKAGLHPFDDKYRFFFVDSRMEGANAVDSIIAALSFLENSPGIQLDALVIARGGGSEQSLAVFNDYRLCRAVCLCSIPVIAAIGHEKDVSAIERCAWFMPTPSTPSGIGKYLQNRYLELQEQLAASITRLVHHFNNVHHGEMAKIRAFLKNIPARAAAYLKWREERFFSLARHLEQSVAFTVRGQERRIGALAALIMKKYRFLILKGGQGIQSLAASIMGRVHTLHRRDDKLLAKTMARLDFEKLRRDNRCRGEETRKKARLLYMQAVRKNTDAQKDLNASLNLVQASDPRQILKKGFTLALDDENRVIQSLEQFKKRKKAALRFHDGTVDIREDENKEV